MACKCKNHSFHRSILLSLSHLHRIISANLCTIFTLLNSADVGADMGADVGLSFCCKHDGFDGFTFRLQAAKDMTQ